MKKLLFIDRDGTLIVEPPITEQVDRFDQIEFLPRVIQNLSFIRHKLDYDFIIVSNQDGLGTPRAWISRSHTSTSIPRRTIILTVSQEQEC